MIQRYSDVAENHLTSLVYRQGRKRYLTLKLWLDNSTEKKIRTFFVLCPHCNSARINIFGYKDIKENFTATEKKPHMILECLKCGKKFLPDDLIIGKEIRKKIAISRRYQLYIKSYDNRPDFESEIISALTRYEAGKKFKARYFSQDFSWDLNKVIDHVIDMTDRIEI